MDSEIKILDSEIETYYYDLAVPYQVARLLPETDENRTLIIRCLDQSLRRLDLRRAYSREFYDSLKDAEKYIQKEFYDKYCGRQEVPTVYCVGHTHIDVAWLWTLGCNQRQGSPKLHDRAGTDEKLSRIYLYVKPATAL